MTDFLDQKRQEIQGRLVDLVPAVEEYNVLTHLLISLEELEGGRRVEPDTPVARGPRKPRRKKAKQAPRGENKRKVLDLVKERPGVTVAEIAEVTGLPKPIVYNVTGQAVKKGELDREDLPGDVIGFKIAQAPAMVPEVVIVGESSEVS